MLHDEMDSARTEVYYGSKGLHKNVTAQLEAHQGPLEDYNAVLGDPLPGYYKQLAFNGNGRVISMNEGTPVHFTSTPVHVARVSIVYFVNFYINPDHQHALARVHLTSLAQTHLVSLTQATVYIELCCPPVDAVRQTQWLYAVAQDLGIGVIITHHPENNHEYFGIHKVWELSMAHPEPTHAVLYFHIKSITRYNGVDRDIIEDVTFNVIRNWKHVMWVFSHFLSVEKVGLSTPAGGWLWHNFWWARASYLIRVTEPIITEDRYYYESWLGEAEALPPHNKITNTYSMITDTIGMAHPGELSLGI